MNQQYPDPSSYSPPDQLDAFPPHRVSTQAGYTQPTSGLDHQQVAVDLGGFQGANQQPPKGNWFTRNAKKIVPFSVLLVGLSVVVAVLLLKDDGGDELVAQKNVDSTLGPVTTVEDLNLLADLQPKDTSSEDKTVVPEGSEPANHGQSVALIKASTVRNTNEDDSPFRETPSVELYSETSLYGTAADHINGKGEYNTDEYISGGYFPGNGAGTFRSSCEVSHFSYDDPVVFPNKPEAAHLHMFIGNTDTNAYSTYDTLMNSGGSTCNGGELNRTAYWVPAMFTGSGEIAVPSEVRFYYKTEKPPGIGNVVVYPENLQLLGDKTNNIQDNLDMATFRCNSIYNGAKGQPSATIPTCPAVTDNGQPGAVEQLIYFDYCWNGDESTIGDWKENRDKNLVPPLNFWHSSVCPESHPKVLPALVTHIFYDIKPGEDTSKWFISSDVNPKTSELEAEGGATAHADWFGAWNKEVNEEWNKNCSNVMEAECGSGLLADPEGDPSSGVRALRLRNDFISGYDSPKARLLVKDIYEQMCSKSDQIPYSPDQGGAQAAYCQPEKHAEISHK